LKKEERRISHGGTESTECSKGEIMLEQVQKVFEYYNGGVKYGEDAIKLLNEAVEGKQTLYFYEK